MFGADTIAQIRGSCYCDGGNWVTKIAAEKIENVILISLHQIKKIKNKQRIL